MNPMREFPFKAFDFQMAWGNASGNLAAKKPELLSLSWSFPSLLRMPLNSL
jgi:hypothetical protein